MKLNAVTILFFTVIGASAATVAAPVSTTSNDLLSTATHQSQPDVRLAQGPRPETNPQAPLRPDDRSGRPETNPQAPLRPEDASGRPETNPQAPLRPNDASGRPETNPQAPLKK